MAANRKIAILGAGRIGESLLAGLLSSGWRKPDDVVVTGRREERLKEVADRHGVKATLSNPEAVADAGLVVIAVKPQDFDVLLGEIGGLLTPEQTVLSVAAEIGEHTSELQSPYDLVCRLLLEKKKKIINKIIIILNHKNYDYYNE